MDGPNENRVSGSEVLVVWSAVENHQNHDFRHDLGLGGGDGKTVFYFTHHSPGESSVTVIDTMEHPLHSHRPGGVLDPVCVS